MSYSVQCCILVNNESSRVRNDDIFMIKRHHFSINNYRYEHMADGKFHKAGSIFKSISLRKHRKIFVYRTAFVETGHVLCMGILAGCRDAHLYKLLSLDGRLSTSIYCISSVMKIMIPLS